MTQIPADASGIDHDWLAVAAAMAGLVLSIGTVTVYSFGVLTQPLQAEFGWSRTQLAVAILISQCAGVAGSPMWGALIDRLGPRKVLLFSVVTMSLLVFLLSMLTPHLAYFYAIYAAFPLASGGASPLGYSSVLVRRFDRHLGLALGLSAMGLGLGAAIVPLSMQILMKSYEWRQVYDLLAATTLLIGLPAALVATRHVRAPAPRHSVEQVPPLWPMVRTRKFGLIGLICFCLGAIAIGVISQLVPMMVDRGFTPTAAAGAIAVSGLASIVTQGLTGWALDRVDTPRMVMLTMLLMGLACLLLAADHGTFSGYLAAALIGGALGAEVNFIPYLTRRLFEPAAFGRLYGLQFAIFVVGGGVGPLMLSASFDHLGGYGPSLLAFTALAGMTALAALKIPRSSFVQP